MKYTISKEWLVKRGQIEEGVEIGAGIAPWTRKAPETMTFDWERFPIRDMFKRGWFKDFTGTLSEALSEPEKVMRQFVLSGSARPVPSFHRQRIRAGSEADPYAALAWKWRVLSVATSLPRRVRFDREAITPEWVKDLVRLSRFEDGPKRAEPFLADMGIKLVIEPHLKSTHLDGAALLGHEGPVVGMTLRFDRLDNFWFVLLHEIVHVKEHLQEGLLEEIVDDLEAAPDSLEAATDHQAGENLIPENVWKKAPPRFLRTVSSVKSFAVKIGVHPAIVAGRIRKESGDYMLFSDLVGQGEVRKQFPSIAFEPNA